MAIRRLANVSDVVDAIGRLRLQQITGKGSPNVSNWLACGNFPAEAFNVMTIELRKLGFSAPPKLWRQIEYPSGRAA